MNSLISVFLDLGNTLSKVMFDLQENIVEHIAVVEVTATTTLSWSIIILLAAIPNITTIMQLLVR